MKKTKFFLFLCLLTILLAGCGKKEQVLDGDKIYYMNQEMTGLTEQSCEITGNTTAEKIEGLLEKLTAVPEPDIGKPLLPENVRILKYTLDKKQLYLDFSAEYLDIDRASEVLARAAFVKTLTQIEEVNYIGFHVEGEPLKDSKGINIGLMNENTFLAHMGSEENATKIVKLNLYYANKSGDKLKVQPSVLEYNANVAVEKVVVEQLIAGPTEEGYYATIPKDTKIISATTKEGVCYVNLDTGFTAQGYDVLGSVTIYSIVNSLTDFSHITSVQILVNGETSVTYKDNISLETIFQKNTEILETEE